MEYIVLVVIILSYFIANIFQNNFSDSLKGRRYPASLFQVFWMFLAMIIFIVLGSAMGGLHFASETVVMGALGSICTIAGGICLLGAMAAGPLSLTILIFGMYVIVPPILSIIFLKEEVSICQIIGMLLIVAVLILSNCGGAEEKKEKSRIWWLLCMGSIVGMGLANYIMKVHQYMFPNEQVWEYSVSIYAAGVVFAALMAVIFFLREKKKSGFVRYPFTVKSFWLPAVGMAITEGVANFGNLYNASRMPAIVLYPVSQLGTLMLTVIFGILVLREKITKLSAACLVLGTVAILLMNF